jgi:hypothetical protein
MPSIPTYNFELLQKKLVDASKAAIKELKRKYPRETICAFALYSDEGARTVSPSFDLSKALAKRLKENEDDPEGTQFSPSEWHLESFGAQKAFDKICEALNEFLDEHPKQFGAFKRQLFETCVCALEQLRKENCFDSEVLVLFTVSDAELIASKEVKLMKRLNAHPTHVLAFSRWTKSW